MRILIVHNAYAQPGGEDGVVENEALALRMPGLEVGAFIRRSSDSWRTKWAAALASLGQGEERSLEREIQQTRPDIVHFHNLTPLFSPRVFQTARRAGAKVVATLHNYRPICLNGLFRTPKGEICERCMGKLSHSPGILRGCYRGSRIQSIALSADLFRAALSRDYHAVDVFIAPSQFLKQKYVESGIPSERIVIQRPFLAKFDETAPVKAQPYLLYLGRLSEEKGIRWLVDRSRDAEATKIVIAGKGPLEAEVRGACSMTLEFAGYVSGNDKAKLLRHASALVLPSECYENAPLVIAEANSAGVPVLLPDYGALSEAVETETNGALYRHHDADSFWSSFRKIVQGGDQLRKRSQDYARQKVSVGRFLDERVSLYQRLTVRPESVTEAPQASG